MLSSGPFSLFPPVDSCLGPSECMWPSLRGTWGETGNVHSLAVRVEPRVIGCPLQYRTRTGWGRVLIMQTYIDSRPALASARVDEAEREKAVVNASQSVLQLAGRR